MSIKKNVISLFVFTISMILISCSNNSSIDDDSADVTSMEGIEEYAGEKITAKGFLECNTEGVPNKAGVHYLKLQDETELKFLSKYSTCGEYDGRLVIVKGELYECGMGDQCVGIGLRNIESIKLAE